MKTSGPIGLVLLAMLAVVFAVGWRLEHQRAAEVEEDFQRLSQELATISRNANSGEHDSISEPVIDPLSPTMNNTALNQQALTPTNHASNNTTTTDVLESNSALRVESVGNESAAAVLPPLASASNESSYSEQQLEIYRCSNQMGAINLAAELWAAEHDGLIPGNLTDLRGYLPPMMLICPGAHPKNLSAGWERFKSEDVTYQILSGSKGKHWDFEIVSLGNIVSVGWLRCPVHNLRVLNGVYQHQFLHPKCSSNVDQINDPSSATLHP